MRKTVMTLLINEQQWKDRKKKGLKALQNEKYRETLHKI